MMVNGFDDTATARALQQQQSDAPKKTRKDSSGGIASAGAELKQSATMDSLTSVDEEEQAQIDFENVVLPLIDLDLDSTSCHFDESNREELMKSLKELQFPCTDRGCVCQRCQAILSTKYHFKLIDRMMYPSDMMDLLNVKPNPFEWPESIRPADADGRRLFQLACCYPNGLASIDTLKELYSRCSQDILCEMDEDGQFPIHSLLAAGAPRSWIRWLANQYIDADSRYPYQLLWNGNGQLPIHVACETLQPLSVLRLCDDKNHVALLMTVGAQNKSALHIACESNASLEVIEYIVENAAPSLNFRTMDFSTPLHIAIRHATVHTFRHLVEKDPELASKTDARGDFPLHVACSKQSPKEVVRLLLDEFPSATSELNCSGYTPLHLCMMHKASLDVVKMLLAVDERPLFHRVENGRNPFLMAVKEGETTIVKYLLERYPFFGVEKYGSWRPLHFAAFYNAPIALLRLLLQKDENGLEERESLGRLPLELATEQNADSDVIKFLASTSTQSEQTSSGTTALNTPSMTTESMVRAKRKESLVTPTPARSSKRLRHLRAEIRKEKE